MILGLGVIAQLVAHHTGSVGVRGSNPLSSTNKALTIKGWCFIIYYM